MQSRRQALVESVVQVTAGWAVSVCAGQWVVFPLFGFHATWTQQSEIGAAFVVFSLAKQYVIRRWFR